jgi:hypothetical protein
MTSHNHGGAQPKAKEGLVVIVMSEQQSVEWCKANLMFGSKEGVSVFFFLFSFLLGDFML